MAKITPEIKNKEKKAMRESRNKLTEKEMQIAILPGQQGRNSRSIKDIIPGQQK